MSSGVSRFAAKLILIVAAEGEVLLQQQQSQFNLV